MGITKVALSAINTKLRLLAVAATSLVTVLMAFTGSASAAMYDCPAARMCMWKDANFLNTRIDWAVEPSGSCLNVPPSMNDVTSSIFNRLSQSVTFYVDANCGGCERPITAGSNQYQANLNNVPGFYCLHDWNDVISSVRFN